MARVQMLQQISGGRGDNTAWPDAGGFLECDDDEARALVRAQHARWADEPPATATMPPREPEPAVAAPPAAGSGDDMSGPENGSQDDDEPADPSKPRVRDPKEAWEQHAVSNFQVHPAAAAAMTKAELTAQFGGTPA